MSGCHQEKAAPQSPEVNKEVEALLAKANDSNQTSFSLVMALAEVENLLLYSKNDSISRDYYFQLSATYYKFRQYESYARISRVVKRKAQAAKDFEQLLTAERSLAIFHYSKSQYDSTYFYYTSAERLSKNLKNNPSLGYIFSGKADILSFKKDFTGAESNAVAALKIAVKDGDERLIYQCSITIGNALVGLKNSTKALTYYLKALETTKNLSQDPDYITLQAQCFNYIAQAYQQMGQHTVAVDYFKRALAIPNLQKVDINAYTYIIKNLGYSLYKIGNPGALGLLLKANKISDSLGNLPGLVSSQLKLSEYYFQKEPDNVKAYTFAKNAQVLAHSKNIFEDELKALDLLAQIDAEHSTIYYKRYIALSDSLQDNERATRDKYARIAYETDEISTQNEIVASDRDRMSVQRWLILGLSLLSILCIVLWFMNKWQRAQKRELEYVRVQQEAKEEIYQLMIEQQQKIEEGKHIEKKRMSQELHDGIMGRLTSIRLNLFVLSKKTDQETIQKCLLQINEIQTIEKEIRIISHDLVKDVFANSTNYNHIIENLVDSFKNHNDVAFQLTIGSEVDWNAVESSLKVQIYRILQESLQNIDKHSNASIVAINISANQRFLLVEIIDNGKGFIDTVVNKGIGLKSIKDRALEMGAALTIESALGRGTEIKLNIPI